MRGLLEKDLCILKQRKNFFLIMFLVCGVLAVTSEGSFVVAYMTLLFSLFSLSTLNYDEFDKSFGFLMTTPINEKIYVVEKFAFALLTGGVGWIISILLVLIAGTVKQVPTSFEEFISYLIYIPTGLLFLAVNMPIQLKYGQEKSRLVMFGMLGVIVAIVYAVNLVLPQNIVDTNMLVSEVAYLPELVFVIIAYIFTAVCVGISTVISIAVMEKKEY